MASNESIDVSPVPSCHNDPARGVHSSPRVSSPIPLSVKVEFLGSKSRVPAEVVRRSLSQVDDHREEEVSI